MKISSRILTAIAVAATTSGTFGDVLEIDLGQFRFGSGTSDYEYVGDYGHLLGSDIDGVNHLRTVATVDLRGLMSMFPGQSIQWITISDPGTNFYNPLSDPGADIDVFAVTGLPDYVDATYTYEGPNARYWDSTSDELAAEVAVVDVDYGGGDAAPWWVSLGEHGSLTMWLDGWLPPHLDGPSDGPGDDPADDPADDPGTDAGGDGDDALDEAAGDEAPEDGGVFDVFEDSKDDLDADVILRDYELLADMFLRLNEVSPTAEWFTITIGLDSAFTPNVVPGPGVAMVVVGSLAALRRRRR